MTISVFPKALGDHTSRCPHPRLQKTCSIPSHYGLQLGGLLFFGGKSKLLVRKWMEASPFVVRKIRAVLMVGRGCPSRRPATLALSRHLPRRWRDPMALFAGGTEEPPGKVPKYREHMNLALGQDVSSKEKKEVSREGWAHFRVSGR